MAEITVLGAFIMDSVARMERFPTAGESVFGKSIRSFPGGKGINQCVAVSRLGGKARMIGMLGTDASARVFCEVMKDEGIDASLVFSCDEPTGSAQIQIDAHGQNRICVIPSANHCFTLDHLACATDAIKRSALVMIQHELPMPVVCQAIRVAKTHGVTVVLNPAPAMPLDDETLFGIDYLTPNETELSVLTGRPTDTDEEALVAARTLIQKGVRTVVATLGARGALIVREDLEQFVPAFSVTAVDTVAAGDSFNGALAVALTEGKPIAEAVRFANAMGALTVGREGAIPSLATRAEVEDFLQAQE